LGFWKTREREMYRSQSIMSMILLIWPIVPVPPNLLLCEKMS